MYTTYTQYWKVPTKKYLAGRGGGGGIFFTQQKIHETGVTILPTQTMHLVGGFNPFEKY